MAELYCQNPAAEVAPLGRGLMVLEPTARKFCSLNATSSAVWEKLKQASSAEQIAQHLVATYEGVSGADALSDAKAIIDEMLSAGIVVPAS